MRCHRLPSALLLCLLGTLAHADVYKWTDQEGRVHYTDRPPPADSHLLSVARTHTPLPSEERPPSPASTPPNAPTPLPPPDTATQERLKAKVAADVAARDASACQSAEERYRQVIGARHLYRTGENGARTYLSDEEVEAARVAARRDVEELCGRTP